VVTVDQSAAAGGQGTAGEASEDLVLERQGEIATLSINRPTTRNALTLAIWQRLPDLLDEIDSDPSVKVLVLRGTGREAFASGADISEFETLRFDDRRAAAYDAAVTRAEAAIASLGKPSIAMVHGYCIGGGCEVAAACDFRFSDERGRFGVTASKIGLVYGLVPTKRLVDLIGPARAKRMLFTAEIWTGRQARERGLVDEVWPVDELEQNVYGFAAELCSRAQFSVRAAKATVRAVLDGHIAETEETLRLQSEGYASPDYREGVRAFLDKRPPRFRFS
jgi:enoyl-CoA hydratase/carnithine racemase